MIASSTNAYGSRMTSPPVMPAPDADESTLLAPRPPAMRGRSTTWTRVAVNLEHVPGADRQAQEALDPDYDPWAEFEFPDRPGQIERAPRKKRDIK